MDLTKEFDGLGVIKRGSFILKSGQHSDVYADFRRVFQDPKVFATVAFRLSKLVTDPSTPFAVAGVPLGGVPYATMVAHILKKPLLLVRDKPKDHGAEHLERKQPIDVILTEDVITAGTSVLQIARALAAEGYRIRQVVCILDRRPASHLPLFSPDIENHPAGIPVASLFTRKLLQPQKEKLTPRLGGKRHLLEDARAKTGSNLVAALDVVCPLQLLKVAERVGPYVCALKLHLDILDFKKMNRDEFCSRLGALKRRFGFLVIEDRKFADIGSINALQLENLPSVVDMVTCHGVTGKAAMLELDKLGFGLLPVYQLSTADNLIDPIYSARVADMMGECKNVVGAISQQRVHGYLTLAPGVNIDQKADGAGQTYRPPDASFADFFIVGRGLYQAEDIEQTARRYLQLCRPKPPPEPAHPSKL